MARKFEWLSAREINNNNLNPELRKFLSDNKLDSKEAKILLKIFKKHKNKILLYSKENLQKLIKVLKIRKNINIINETVLNKIRQIANWTRKSVNSILKNNFEQNDISRSYLIKKIDRLLMIKKSCFSKILDSFKSEVNVKLNNISKKIQILKSNPKKIRLFQENAKLLWWYNWNIDWDWWRLTEKAFDKYLSAKWLNRQQLIKLKQIIDKKKQYNLDKAILSHHHRNKELFWKWWKYEWFNERDIKKQLIFEKIAFKFFRKYNWVWEWHYWSYKKRRELRKLILKNTWLDIFNQSWCAATVWTLLKMSWYSLKNVKNIHSALSYAWLSRYWPKNNENSYKGHICISTWNWCWDANSIVDAKNSIWVIRKTSFKNHKIIGWIMPKYAGQFKYLHRHWNPPKWALVIYMDYRIAKLKNKKSLSYQVSNYWYYNNKRKRYRRV